MKLVDLSFIGLGLHEAEPFPGGEGGGAEWESLAFKMNKSLVPVQCRVYK